MTGSLPLFCFKPTICWIDDDRVFLDAVSMIFKQYYNCLAFNSPDEALIFFNSYQAPLSNITFRREFTESDLFGTNHRYPVDIKIPAIKDLLSMQNKSEEIAILIVDYHMPDINGVELCKKLSALPIKKILLTGDATHEKATEAFNQGLIHQFIRKNSDVTEKLKNCIDELITQYFYEQTMGLISHIEASKPSLLSDRHFINFFNHWRHENNIDEFYLVHKQGSFLVKDKNGKLSYFIAMSEHDKNEFVRLNDELLDGKSGRLLNDVADGKTIPFFGVDKESWDVETSEWDKHFYPAEMISGNENYYWAVVNK